MPGGKEKGRGKAVQILPRRAKQASPKELLVVICGAGVTCILLCDLLSISSKPQILQSNHILSLQLLVFSCQLITIQIKSHTEAAQDTVSQREQIPLTSTLFLPSNEMLPICIHPLCRRELVIAKSPQFPKLPQWEGCKAGNHLQGSELKQIIFHYTDISDNAVSHKPSSKCRKNHLESVEKGVEKVIWLPRITVVWN